jgi:hypothetical protein
MRTSWVAAEVRPTLTDGTIKSPVHTSTAALAEPLRNQRGVYTVELTMKAVVVAVLCTLLAACAVPPPSSSPLLTPTGAASQTPLASSAPLTSPTTSGSPELAATCRTADLGITVVNAGAAAGMVGGYLRFTNASTETCRLRGWPTIVGVAADGTTVASRHTNAVLTFPDIRIALTVVLGPGAIAYAAFAGGDNPRPQTSTCPPSFLTLRVTPPENVESVALSAWNPGYNQFLPDCAGIEVTMVVPAAALTFLEPSPTSSAIP